VEPLGSAARAARIGAMLGIVVLAFAAGLALRAAHGESGRGATVANPPAPLRTTVLEATPVRLVRADPDTLRRAAATRTPGTTGTASGPEVPTAAQPVPPSGGAATPPAAAPAPVPQEPAPEATPVGTFDMEG
jgi:hypothetical protein